ncbi:MAG: class I SAM-dependent methyltransferase [Burkholderiales bacterium]|jgi:2-polyprenyl-3-methyl-5-hydroxy-6-metoxy-1,4-benzoquinol methylase|nr:class I SAM-dependent methyltransferase [Burkholderiales bacterium]
MLSKFQKMLRQRLNRETLYSTAAYWDSKASEFKSGDDASMWPNSSLNRLYDAEQKAKIAQLLGKIVPHTVLLDIGCGTGRMSRWFAEQSTEVTGIDFSFSALQIAQQRTSDNNPVYRHVSIFEFSEEACYDMAFTWGCLTVACQHRAQLLEAFLRIRRALKPEGSLLLMEPVHRGFLHRVLNMDLPEFIETMKEAGFEVTRKAPLHFWPMRLLLCYVPLPMWITRPLYHCGQFLMRMPGLSGLGDYWVMLAHPVGETK